MGYANKADERELLQQTLAAFELETDAAVDFMARAREGGNWRVADHWHAKFRRCNRVAAMLRQMLAEEYR